MIVRQFVAFNRHLVPLRIQGKFLFDTFLTEVLTRSNFESIFIRILDQNSECNHLLFFFLKSLVSFDQNVLRSNKVILQMTSAVEFSLKAML